MPYSTLSLSVTVPSENIQRAREILETSADQIVIEKIPTYDVDLTERCVDPPEYLNEE